MILRKGSISVVRFVFLALIGAVFLLGTLFFAYSKGLNTDKQVVILGVDIVFLLIFYLLITKKRLSGAFYSGTSYLSLFFVFILGMVFLFVISKISVFYVPIIILPLIFSSWLDEGLALGVSIFLFLIYSMCMFMSHMESLMYILMAVLGVFTGSVFKRSKKIEKILMTIITFGISFIVPLMFYYILYYDIPSEAIIYSLINALISAIFICFVYNLMSHFFSRERQYKYEVILDDNYSILRDLRLLSMAEYNHARFVAKLSGTCADAIGGDVVLATAAGLYYHGENYDGKGNHKKFLKTINNRCFPTELINILSEKVDNGVLPTSKEAAIVHITDTLVTKIEALMSVTDQNSWNMNMIVYQTLNELSSNGAYDKSGLGMNEFLKIREILANTEYV